MTERTEVEEALAEANEMLAIFESDTFKEFYNKIDKLGEDLGKVLVDRWNTFLPDDRQRHAIENQMCFVSGLKNYVNGWKMTKEQALIELERLDEEQREAGEVA